MGRTCISPPSFTARAISVAKRIGAPSSRPPARPMLQALIRSRISASAPLCEREVSADRRDCAIAGSASAKNTNKMAASLARTTIGIFSTTNRTSEIYERFDHTLFFMERDGTWNETELGAQYFADAPVPALRCCAAASTIALSRVLEDHNGGFFGNHGGGRVGIARGDGRHHRGVGDAKPGNPVKAQALVDHRRGIAGRTHLRGYNGMKAGGADVAAGLGERSIVVADRRARQELGRVIGRQRLLLHQPSCGADGIGCDLTVFVGGKIVRRDRGRLIGLG